MVRVKRKKKLDAGWRVVRVETTPGLWRLIGPVRPGTRKGMQKTICVAIGSKRLRSVVQALNEMGVEV